MRRCKYTWVDASQGSPWVQNPRLKVMKMTFINLTPHPIVLNDGRVFEPSGVIARVSANHTPFVDGIAKVEFGEVLGLPAEIREGVHYIVSALVAQACKRPDVVAPATGHSQAVRNEKGHITSVPGFVRA